VVAERTLSKRAYLFAAWCLVIILAAILMSYFAWSPFADGARSSGGGGARIYGPSHK
jgi:hypothetical protein